MILRTMCFTSRAAYSAANTFPFLFTIIAINALADFSTKAAVVIGFGVIAGFFLGGLTLLTLDLADTGDRRITTLTILATLGYLLMLWAPPTSAAMLGGGVILAFLCWLPYMVAESAGQVVRVAAFLSEHRHASRLSQLAQAAIDAITFGSIALLLSGISGPAGTRTWATIAMTISVVLVGALSRRLRATPPTQITVCGPRSNLCQHPTITLRRRWPTT